MKPRSTLFGVLVVTGVVTLSGCVNLKPKVDPTRFYVLPAPATNSAAGSDCDQTVLVGPVQIGGGADRPSIVEQISATEVRYLDWDRWAEPLAQSLPRAVVVRLAARMPDRCVQPFQRATPGTKTVQIILSIDEFGITPEDQAVLAVRWRVVEFPDGNSVSTGTSSFTAKFDSSTNRVAAGVEALGKTLDQLSAKLAGELEK